MVIFGIGIVVLAKLRIRMNQYKIFDSILNNSGNE